MTQLIKTNKKTETTTMLFIFTAAVHLNINDYDMI